MIIDQRTWPSGFLSPIHLHQHIGFAFSKSRWKSIYLFSGNKINGQHSYEVEKVNLGDFPGYKTSFILHKKSYGKHQLELPKGSQSLSCTINLRQAKLIQLPLPFCPEEFNISHYYAWEIIDTQGRRILLPCSEILRVLYFNHTAISRELPFRSWLYEIMHPVAVGHYESLTLHFTQAIKASYLSHSLVRHIALLAIHPAWNKSLLSFYRYNAQAVEQGIYLPKLDPPAVDSLKFSFRGVWNQNTFMVHQINQLSGLEHCINTIAFTHPDITSNTSGSPSANAKKKIKEEALTVQLGNDEREEELANKSGKKRAINHNSSKISYASPPKVKKQSSAKETQARATGGIIEVPSQKHELRSTTPGYGQGKLKEVLVTAMQEVVDTTDCPEGLQLFWRAQRLFQQNNNEFRVTEHSPYLLEGNKAICRMGDHLARQLMAIDICYQGIHARFIDVDLSDGKSLSAIRLLASTDTPLHTFDKVQEDLMNHLQDYGNWQHEHIQALYPMVRIRTIKHPYLRDEPKDEKIRQSALVNLWHKRFIEPWKNK